MRLVSGLLSEVDMDLDELCEALVYVFESCGRSLQLLRWAIENEVQSTSKFVDDF